MQDKAYLVNPVLDACRVVTVVIAENTYHAILVVHTFLVVNNHVVVKVTCESNAEEATIQGHL